MAHYFKNLPVIAGVIIGIALIVAYLASPAAAEAQEETPAAAVAAAAWLQENAAQHESCTKLEAEWGRNKQVIATFNCRLHGETREIIDCTPF